MTTTMGHRGDGRGAGSDPEAHDQPLSRERIVDAALALIDREGARALSMRRVAAELGAGAMSLYNHVADKAELQRALLQRVLEGIAFQPDADPRVSGHRLARDVRDRFLAHPGIVGLLGGGAEAPPLRDAFTASYGDLVERGLPDDLTARMLTAVSRYTIGAVLAELYGQASKVDRAQRDAEFDFGLDALFTGFAVRLGVDPAELDPIGDPIDDDDGGGSDPGTEIS